MTRRDILRALALSLLPIGVRGQGRIEPIRHEVYGAGPQS